jgi:hypothetical protein
MSVGEQQIPQPGQGGGCQTKWSCDEARWCCPRLRSHIITHQSGNLNDVMCWVSFRVAELFLPPVKVVRVGFGSWSCQNAILALPSMSSAGIDVRNVPPTGITAPAPPIVPESDRPADSCPAPATSMGLVYRKDAGPSLVVSDSALSATSNSGFDGARIRLHTRSSGKLLH